MTLRHAVVAEAIGSFFLFATVVGSGIMAERLSGGNVAIALLGNTLATGAMLFVLIVMLGPISGAHFNPAVSLVMALRREISARTSLAYIVVQLVFGIGGVWAAHLMFDLPIVQLAHHAENRSIFARGAIRAASWLIRQPPGRYTMDHVIGM